MELITKKEKIHLLLTSLFCGLVLLANLFSAKWVWLPLFPEGVPGGLILFPFTFLLSDLVLELFGKKRAQWMVLQAFFIASFSWILLGAIALWPEGKNHLSFDFKKLFDFFGASMFSSLAAYLISQLCDLKIYDFIGKKTGARHLWLRSGASTLFSQGVDTVLVNGLMFTFFIPQAPQVVLQLMLVSYLYKAIVTVLMVPIYYLIVRAFKQLTGSYGIYQQA